MKTVLPNDWLPGAQPGDYVASADITARKPETACCGDDCCAESDRTRRKW